jgi:dihydrofolate reductase
MRKLKLQVQITVDGFIAGPNGEMDWVNMNWGQDINDFVTQLTDSVNTILLGRNLAEGFIPHWTAAYNQPTPEPGSETFVKTPKIVFSKSLTKSEWDNTIVVNGNLKDEVTALKNNSGKDLIAYGGSKFVSSLIKEKLVDELYLFINPVIIGKGMPIFQEVSEKHNLKLISSKTFECGIIVLTYKPE